MLLYNNGMLQQNMPNYAIVMQTNGKSQHIKSNKRRAADVPGPPPTMQAGF